MTRRAVWIHVGRRVNLIGFARAARVRQRPA